MSGSNVDDNIGTLLGSITSMVDQSTAEVVSKDSKEVDLEGAIRDVVYGLLSLEILTSPQIALLAALAPAITKK